MDAPATPTADIPGLDDSMTFELLDGSSVIQNRKRRRSSLRRVSFAERPSIHIFARDDDYETPPEGTLSHLSAQSTPTSVSRSPQRRSERLSAAKGRRQGENEVDKENVPTSSGSNARLKKRGRRPLALRDTQKEKVEEFLKPSNWLDDQENSAFGSCDDNTGPVDLRFITSGGRQSVSADDDDNMTMDSQTFQTRMSQMLLKQQLQRLSEGRETATVTYTDMDVTVGWPGTQAQEGEEKLLDQPTWHKGDGNLSDMSQGSFDGLSIVRILANKKSSQKESSIHDTDGNTTEGGDNWTKDDADSQGRMASMQIRRPAFLPGADDTVSMETSPLVSNGERRKLFTNEGEQSANTRNVHDAGVSDGSQMQGGRTSKETELHAGRPLMISNNRTSICDYDDDVSMETTSQSRTGGMDLTVEMNSGTDERLFNRNLHSSTTVRGSESMELECAALESQVHRAAEPNVVHVDDAVKFNSFSQPDAGAGEDSPVPSRHDERNFKRVSTSVAEKNSSVPMQARLGANSHSLVPLRHAQSMPVEPVAGQRVYPCNQGLERQESSLQQRIVNNDLRNSVSSHAFGGFVNQSINQETSLPAPNEDTVSMDITRAWNERGPRHTKSSDSADSFLWGNKDQRMDMSDVDMTERYQEGITEAMPKLTSVLGGYNCDSPSVEPLKRIFQRNSNMDAEDSPVYGLTADDIQKETSSKQDDDIALHRAVNENETVSNRGFEGDTEDLQSNIGKNKNKFQNPEDTFSFKGHQKNKKETSISKPMGQDVMPRPAFPSVKEKVEIIEANLKNHSAPQDSGQDLQDEDATADYTGQHNWRAEVSSDMSASPLSPRRPNHFQLLVKNSQTAPEQIDMGSTDSPSFRDDITAAIPNVQDLLAADGETPESELGWNPRKIVWSAPKSKLQSLGNEVVTRQPGIDAMEDENTHSMADKLCTPTGPEQKKNMFDCMSEVADRTLNQVSHSKEVRNSVASKIVLRMMSFQDNDCAQPESSSDVESQQILRRTLHFQPESDGQLQSQSPRRDVDQQIITRDADGTMEVESIKLADEESDLNEARVNLVQREGIRQKLLLEIQVAEERILSQEGRYEELSKEVRETAQDCHQVMEKRSRKDIRFEMKEMAAFFSQAQFNELERRCKLLICMQTEWNLKTKNIGDDQVLHEFKYWSLFTHRILKRKENKAEFTVCKSMIDFNEESINQVFRHMNASLAWRWLLSGQDEIFQHQDLRDHVQGVHSKVMILLDLMEEVNYCRKYLVIPRFRLLTGSGLRLELQFSDSKLLFDFVLLFDMRQVTQTWYSREHEQKIRQADTNQKLDCTVEIECAGRFFGKKITEADIRRSVASVVAGHQLFPRVCASVNTLILSMKD